jgi:hypothetical protein
MQPRPSFDRSLLIPIAIIVVSILGMCLIFLTSYLGKSFIPPTASPSPFRLLRVATRTPSPSATSTQEETPTATDRPPTETLTSTSTVTESVPTSSSTPTPEGIQPLRAGKYDDTNPNIAYDPHWTALKNSSTANSYKGTIHASASMGSEASFRFTGKQIRLGYQRGNTFGTVTVLIDDQSYGFHEQAFDLVWSSPQLSPGDHFVRIIHQSGESINLDSIEVRE